MEQTVGQISAWFFGVKDWLTALVAIVAAVGTIYGWVIRPIKQSILHQQELDKQQTSKIDELKHMIEDLSKRVDSNQAEYIRDRLQTLREHYCHEVGWASIEEKRRIVEWYEDYRRRGFNHLSESYIHDIESLPERPTK